MSFFILCRPGFEPEAAAEITEWASSREIAGYPQAERGHGWAKFQSLETISGKPKRPPRDLIFARQCVSVIADLDSLDPSDRISPMLAALQASGFEKLSDFLVEHPDSDQARPLAGLARSFGNALRPALKKRGWLTAAPVPQAPCLHVCFLSGTHAIIGLSFPNGERLWPQGIPRLRLPKEAPSRSAQKLEEAIQVLMEEDQRDRWLRAGMSAADLGAAPGGWTWILTRHQLHVIAIDNGPLSDTVMATGLVRHLRADGFSWHPPQPLDWMVCDMVEQPKRVANRMAEWFTEGWCRRAIFNLKLPMKKRYAEVQANLAQFHAQCEAAGIQVQTRARQLYHDREEITVFAWVGR